MYLLASVLNLGMVEEELQGVEVSHNDLLHAEYPQVHDPLPDIKTWSDKQQENKVDLQFIYIKVVLEQQDIKNIQQQQEPQLLMKIAGITSTTTAKKEDFPRTAEI